jgi:hypothetical protein
LLGHEFVLIGGYSGSGLTSLFFSQCWIYSTLH